MRVLLCLCGLWSFLTACSNVTDPTLKGSIVYSVCEDPACQQESVYVMDADGSNVERIGSGTLPIWSPDGTRVAFLSPLAESPSVYLYDTRTKQTVRLYEGFVPYDYIAWSPDGTEIAVPLPDALQGDFECHADIWIISVDDGDRRQVTDGDACDRSPAWSPDGRRIAFTRYEDRERRVYFAAIDGSQIQALAPSSSDPLWSPDGTQIAFVKTDLEGNRKLCISNLDGTYRQLTDIAVENIWFRWSPDGRQIAFTVDDALHLINADGTDLRTVLESDWHPEELDWSPDGTRLVVTSFRLSTQDAFLYTMRLDGSDGQMLTSHNRNSHAPDWGPEPSIEHIVAS